MEIVEEEGLPRRWKIVVSGQERRVSATILSSGELSRLSSPQDVCEAEKKGAIKYAIRCLSRQAMHSAKLAKMLHNQFVSDEVVEATVAYCQRQGWLDDAAWIDSKVKSWERQGKSLAYIKAKLAQYRIPMPARFDEEGALASIIKKKYSSLLDPTTPYPIRSRALQSLLRRGFSYEKVKDFLQKNSALCMMGEE